MVRTAAIVVLLLVLLLYVLGISANYSSASHLIRLNLKRNLHISGG